MMVHWLKDWQLFKKTWVQFHYHYSSSQLSVTLILYAHHAIFWPLWHQVCMWYRHTCKQSIHTND